MYIYIWPSLPPNWSSCTLTCQKMWRWWPYMYQAYHESMFLFLVIKVSAISLRWTAQKLQSYSCMYVYVYIFIYIYIYVLSILWHFLWGEGLPRQTYSVYIYIWMCIHTCAYISSTSRYFIAGGCAGQHRLEGIQPVHVQDFHDRLRLRYIHTYVHVHAHESFAKSLWRPLDTSTAPNGCVVRPSACKTHGAKGVRGLVGLKITTCDDAAPMTICWFMIQQRGLGIGR